MRFKENCFFLIVCLASIVAGNYTLVGPKSFRPGTGYRVIVTVHGPPKLKEYRFNARIEDQLTKKILVQDQFHAHGPEPIQEFELKIPNQVPDSQYQLVYEASGHVNFNGTYAIQVRQKTFSLLIQTDKYLYKPGQKVLYRVIGFDAELKPYTGFINVTIYDKSDNRIYQKEMQKNISGVISGQLQLSDITPIGQWRIEAKSERVTKVVNFQVAEYVLPKYEVKVILPSYFLVNKNNPSAQKPLLITTTATYTFGKPVKGYALITISLQCPSWWRNNNNNTPKAISKNVELVDGKADTSVTLQELNTFGELNADYCSIFVQSNVTETPTGIILQGNGTVPIKFQKYALKFLSISADNYKPGFNYKAYVQLSQVDDSEPASADIKNPNGTFKSLFVTVTNYKIIPSSKTTVSTFEGEPIRSIWRPQPPQQSSSRSFSLPLSDGGFVAFEVPTETDWSSMNLDVQFFDQETLSNVSVDKSTNPFDARDKKYIQLSLTGNGQAIKPNSILNLNVKTSELITMFNYEILGKGQILVSDARTLQTPSNSTNFEIRINADLALKLAPTAIIVVSYVTSTGELVADSLALSVIEYTKNKPSISFSKQSTSPGEEVVLQVKAPGNSFVSLLAVDLSVLLLSTQNDITSNMVDKEINDYSGSTTYYEDNMVFRRFWWPIWLGGQDTSEILNKAGLFVVTDYYVNSRPVWDILPFFKFANGPVADRGQAENMPRLEPNPPQTTDSPRKNFPETWIWSDVSVGANNVTELTFKVPDTMTEWVATAFATNTQYGFGVANNSAKVTVLKPFFISLNLPYNIIRGELFAVQATVFNYYGTDLEVDVTLVNSTYFKVIKCSNGSELPPSNDKASKKIKVANNDMVTLYFWIVATSLGQIPVEVKAVAGVAADSLIVNLLVKPEGQPQSYSSSSMLRLPQDQPPEVKFHLSLPPPDVLVNGSVVIEATVIGDIMGSTINNLDKLLQMPYGCGEQNMVTHAPNVYIIMYLTKSNQLTDDIKTKAIGFMNAGYQRELTYQRSDGSFSAFGNSDPAGSVWLSAFVARVFQQSSDFIAVEETKIAQCLRWILQNQSPEGTFSEPPGGKVIHTDMQGGASAGIGLTAYVAISLLVNKNTAGVPNLQQKISLTISYLESHYSTYSNDSYALSIIGYAFYLSGSPKLTDVLQLLDSLATVENGLKYWHKKVKNQNQPTGWRPPYESAHSSDIEMTAYVLLIVSSKGDFSNALPIAKWLLSKRNANGGFESTQDTVLGLESLSVFGTLIQPPTNSNGLIVKVAQDATTDVYTFATINRDSALLLQSHQLPSKTTNVTFSATGQGLALIQVNVKYYINSGKDDKLIKQTLTANSSGNKLDLKICVSWLGTEVTGMVLVEVNLLTGFTLSEGYVDVLARDIGKAFKKQELGENRLSIYLDELTSINLCFTVKLERTFYVKLVKPALVKTYRYYAPNEVTSGYYSPSSTSETINVCDPLFNM